jgi:flagellar basal-body rod protein FlgB
MINALFNDPQYLSMRTLMDASQARHTALAGNIANVNTPGYQRKDFNPIFKMELEKAIQSKDVNTLKSIAPKISLDSQAGPVRMDGSNVNLERELIEMAKNSAQYEVSAAMIAKKYAALRLAITGKV